MYDTHVHTTFSPDGSSSLGDYVRLIDEGKLEGIGFTEHFDFLPECGAYKYLDYDAYKATVGLYKSKGYDFHLGAEVDYAKRVEEEILDTLRHKTFEYTICSVHMIQGISVSDRQDINLFYDTNAFRSILENYYEEVSSCLKTDAFDVVGHIGIYRRYFEPEFFEKHLFKSWIDEMDHQLAKECAASGKVIEANTSGLFAGFGATLAHPAFLKTYFEYGGRQVSVGSDAHQVTNAGRGMETAFEMLKEIGFEYTVLPWDKEHPVKIG